MTAVNVIVAAASANPLISFLMVHPLGTSDDLTSG
jgi:hypothetical protein